MSQSELLISICIPTYNRSKYLLELLESIDRELARLDSPIARSQLEICISDNASSDDTLEAVRAWQSGRAHSLSLTIQCQRSNLGPDRNYLAVAALAKGEYIWFMGSDDAVAEHGMARVAAALAQRPTFVLGSRLNCTLDMVPEHPCPWLNIRMDRRFDFSHEVDLDAYLHAATSLGAVFSYLSSILVRRESWHSIATDETYIGSAYVHVQKCLGLVTRGATLEYIDTPIVCNRGNNDSFESAGAVNRVMIDLFAYTRLSTAFDKDAKARKAFLGILAKERPRVHTAFYLRKNGTASQWEAARAPLVTYGVPRSLLKLLNLMPQGLGLLRAPVIRKLGRALLGRRHPGRD